MLGPVPKRRLSSELEYAIRGRPQLAAMAIPSLARASASLPGSWPYCRGDRGASRASASIAGAGSTVDRCWISRAARSPRCSSRSWTPSADRARNRSSSCCSWRSTSASASASSSSRSPPRRAARAAGPGRSRAPARGARPAGRRRRRCSWRRSRRAAPTRTARGSSESTVTVRISRASTAAASRPAPECRRRRAGTRGRPRASSGTSRTARPPRAGPPRACAAARAASVRRAGAAAGAARGPRLRGTSPRTAPCRRAAARPALRPRPTPAAAAPDRAASPFPETGRRIHRRSTSSRRRAPVSARDAFDDRHRPRRVDARRRTATAGRSASRPARRACARSRSCGRRAQPRSLRPGRRGSGAGSPRRARRDRDASSAAAIAAAGGICRRLRTSSPMWRPSSSGRPAASAFQNGILPGWPGAGDTSTRSCVISSMRHDEAPSRNVSPTRLSNTISSSSSPTRACRVRARRSGTRRRGRDRGSCRR